MFLGNCRDYYNSVGFSILHMLEFGTTVSSPEAFSPVYECQPWSVFFFASFMFMYLYLLVALVLAVTYA